MFLFLDILEFFNPILNSFHNSSHHAHHQHHQYTICNQKQHQAHPPHTRTYLTCASSHTIVFSPHCSIISITRAAHHQWSTTWGVHHRWSSTTAHLQLLTTHQFITKFAETPSQFCFQFWFLISFSFLSHIIIEILGPVWVWIN